VAENKITEELAHFGQAPKTYATFNNGCVYEYIEGIVLTAEDLPNYSKPIAIAFSIFHNTNITSVPSEPQFFSTLVDWYNQVLKYDIFEGFLIRDLTKEIEWLKKKTHGFTVGFCHNDLQSRNIIWNGKEIRFIDFEYSCYNYIAFDLGNHFCEYQDLHLDTTKFPSISKQLEFLRFYTKDVDFVFDQVQVGILMSNLFWGIWSIYQKHHSDIDYDFGKYGKRRLELYFEGKSNLDAILNKKHSKM
jgi:ethanolamine kinase